MRSLYASTTEVADKATNPTQSAQVTAPIGVKISDEHIGNKNTAILLKFVKAIPLKFVKTGAHLAANTKRTNSGFCVMQQG